MKKLIMALAIIVVAISMMAFTANEENKSYSYVLLHQIGDLVVTSGKGIDYEEEKVKSEKQDKLRDMGPILLRIKEYEGRGFSLVDSEMSGQSMIVLMRKEL